MKAIILAGGKGTRLYPLTITNSKQLLPVYDKPMIYYPLSVVMMSEIKEVLIISTPDHLGYYQELLQEGSHLGIKISYKVQFKPEGLSQALLIGEDFLNGDECLLVLGDNILFGHGLQKILKKAKKECKEKQTAVVMGYPVKNPKEYGVVEFIEDHVVSIEEKPKNPKSNIAIIGFYFFPKDASKSAKNINKSSRGEYEISSLNSFYLAQKKLKLELLGRGFAWFDSGTHSSLLDASNFVQSVQDRQGLYIACLEEIALKNGFVSKTHLRKHIENCPGSSDYFKFIKKLIK